MRTLKKTNKVLIDLLPYSGNPDISVVYELSFGDDLIKPGDKIQFRGSNSWYVFSRVAHNSKLDSTWIDCTDVITGETKSFHVYKLRKVNRPKKSRKKRAAKQSS